MARFHRAVDDLEHAYRHVRGAHDTALHMERLDGAATGGQGRRLADAILDAWRTWRGRHDLPLRHCHGDLEVSNLRFSEAWEEICLLDLDTLALQSIDGELGDAWGDSLPGESARADASAGGESAGADASGPSTGIGSTQRAGEAFDPARDCGWLHAPETPRQPRRARGRQTCEAKAGLQGQAQTLPDRGRAGAARATPRSCGEEAYECREIELGPSRALRFIDAQAAVAAL